LDEQARLRQVLKWQHKLLRSLQAVLSPDTHLEPCKSARKESGGLEFLIINKADENLKEQHDIIASNIEQGLNLIDLVNDAADIVQDDHSRVIFVFTAVTVVFLPMGFVAAYLSMNGGPSNPDWGNTQRLFWSISVPLAVVIGIFCLMVAWQGPEGLNIKLWIVDRVYSLKGRILPGGKDTASSDADSYDSRRQ
jgi:Mg2+ and Co2+ transporter CorA